MQLSEILGLVGVIGYIAVAFYAAGVLKRRLGLNSSDEILWLLAWFWPISLPGEWLYRKGERRNR